MPAYVLIPLKSSLRELGGINCVRGKRALIWGIDEGRDTKEKKKGACVMNYHVANYGVRLPWPNQGSRPPVSFSPPSPPNFAPPLLRTGSG